LRVWELTALRVFVRTAPIDLPRVNEVAIDGRVLAFAAAVSTIAGIAVAALPAWRQSRVDVERQLRAGALTTTSDRGGIRARAVLLALQIALSLAGFNSGKYHARIASELRASLAAVPQTAYEKKIQARAQELSGLMNQDDAFHARVRKYQGFPE